MTDDYPEAITEDATESDPGTAAPDPDEPPEDDPGVAQEDPEVPHG